MIRPYAQQRQQHSQDQRQKAFQAWQASHAQACADHSRYELLCLSGGALPADLTEVERAWWEVKTLEIETKEKYRLWRDGLTETTAHREAYEQSRRALFQKRGELSRLENTPPD